VIAIHAGSRKPDSEDVAKVQKRLGRRGTVPDEYVFGAIVATARVVGTVSIAQQVVQWAARVDSRRCGSAA
jgi:methenyltetrahydromethanopterin cyclohydrolase